MRAVVVAAAEVVTAVADDATRPDHLEADHVVRAGARREGALRPSSLPRQRGRSAKPHADALRLDAPLPTDSAPGSPPGTSRPWLSLRGTRSRLFGSGPREDCDPGHVREVPSPVGHAASGIELQTVPHVARQQRDGPTACWLIASPTARPPGGPTKAWRRCSTPLPSSGATMPTSWPPQPGASPGRSQR